MPKFKTEEQLEKLQGGHFGFEAPKISDLLATEYTLVTIIADRSGSTAGFQKEMESAIKQVVEACKASPRADNLLIRVLAFESKHEEVHGFQLLSSIGTDGYDGSLTPGGMTALYDACIDGVEATSAYGRKLLDEDYQVNGIVVVITDGMENQSTLRGPDNDPAKFVRAGFENAVRGENLESMVSILIAVNSAQSEAAAALNAFHKNAGFTHFIELKDASPKTLAKMARFISESISSQSQALGTGGPSKQIGELSNQIKF
jgi:hypothetical protein